MSEPTPDGREESSRPLGALDVAAMTLVAVVSLRWIARSARAGAPSLLLWTLAWATFLLPLAVTVMRLSREHPEEAGPYAWTRKAFGASHAFVCGWCLWVNNLFYFPSLLLFAAANAASAPLADSETYSVVFVLGALWACVLLNVLGLRFGKWLQNAGSLGTWIPALVLIAAGALALARFGSATPLGPSALVPRSGSLDTLVLWSSLCFAFSGFEIGAMVTNDVRDPARTVRRGVLIASVAVTVIYMLGTASVLVAIPPEALSERSGIADAVKAVSERVGLPGLGGLIRIVIVLGALAQTSAWFAAAATLPHAAGVLGTPRRSLVVQGVASTAVFLASLFLRAPGAKTSIQDAYDILVNLTIAIYFVPYLYVFASFVKLKPGTRSPAAFAIGGLGFISTLASLALVFVPPPDTKDGVSFLLNIVLQGAAVVGVGLAIFVFNRARRAPSR